MAEYVVTGAAVVLATADGSERYLYRGAPFPGSAFKKESLKHAEEIGLIEKVAATEQETPTTAAPTGVPSEEWTVVQIDAWAAAQEPPLTFATDVKTKAEKLTAIAAQSRV